MTTGGKNPFQRQIESTLKLWKLPAWGWGIKGDRQRESRDAKLQSQHLSSLFSLLHTLQKFTLRFSALLRSSLFPPPPDSCTGCSHTNPLQRLRKSSNDNKRGMKFFFPKHTSIGSTAGWLCGPCMSVLSLVTAEILPCWSHQGFWQMCFTPWKHWLISQHLQTSRNSNFSFRGDYLTDGLRDVSKTPWILQVGEVGKVCSTLHEQEPHSDHS